MDTSVLHSVLFTAAIVPLVLFPACLRGDFVPAGSVIDSIAQKSSITVSQFCGDEVQCRSLLNQTRCDQLKVCHTVETCSGRDDFPSAENALQNWTLQSPGAGCAVSEEKPSDIPQNLLFPHSVHVLNVNSSDSAALPCHAGRGLATITAFSLTFWLKANCANCSVVALFLPGGQDTVSLRVTDGFYVCLGDECFSNDQLQSDKWAFVALTHVSIDKGWIFINDNEASLTEWCTHLISPLASVKLFLAMASDYMGDGDYHNINYGNVYKDTVSLYLDGEIVKKEATDLNFDSVQIGSTEGAPSGGLYSVLHVQFFQDVLTPREITEMTTGLADVITGKCRCFPDYPHISQTQESLCVNDRQETSPRFNSSIKFNGPSVLLDGSSSNWASAEQGKVILMINMSMSYQIESIVVEFEEPPPTHVAYVMISGNQEKAAKNFTCSQMSCSTDMQPLDKSASPADFANRIADNLKIELNRDHNDDVRSFIIKKIIISGRCDCHGNAASCTINEKTYTCSCDASTNTRGFHCQSCQANFFRQPEDFDCQNSCQCFTDGVANQNDLCNENGGQCYCKEQVEGFRCDTCKPWTYNLDSRKMNGCTPCPCYQEGSESCSNVTGVCTCKRNVASPNCQQCRDNHYGFTESNECDPCECDPTGTVGQSLQCHDISGQCPCKTNVDGRRCDKCKSGFHSLDTQNVLGCTPCDCNLGASVNDECDRATGQCACRGGVTTDHACTPEIISVDPTYGPLYGGTRIFITGELLGNFTRSVSVYLGNAQQTIISVNDSVIEVKTHQQAALGQVDLKIGWVGLIDLLTAPSKYTYKSNPVVNEAQTVMGSSFVSGGCLVMLYGSNLLHVKYPYLKVMRKDDPTQFAKGSCYNRANKLNCPSPNVNSLFSSNAYQFTMVAVFDGITIDLGDVEIKPDPEIKNAGNIEFQYPFEDSITIYGEGFLSACETSSYSVHVGVVSCAITAITNTKIECKPPKMEPGSERKYFIKVSIGNIERKIGTLEYLKFYETTGFAIIIGCIAAVIAVVLIVIIVCCCRRRCQRLRSSSSSSTRKLDNKARSNHRQMNTYTDINTVTNGNANGTIRMESVIREPKRGIVNTEAETNILQEEFLPHVEPSLRDDVSACFIGGGSFSIGATCIVTGKKAKITDGNLHRNGHPVQRLVSKSFTGTIKENLQDPRDEDSLLLPWVQQVLKECLRFQRHKHNHLLSTLGIGVDKQRIHLLYNYMSKGTLKNLVADTSQGYSVRKLLGFSQQVAEGVAFLASKDITHKDVAARNCMVDDFSVVKLGDGALAWDYYPNEYVYNQQRERHMPLRWMAPESIESGYYDMKTDVWSFGVLIWELLTRGCLPFHEVGDADLDQYILHGYILGKPETISDSLYSILQNCWSPVNENRPSIASVSTALSNILESDNTDTYINLASVNNRHSQEANFYCSTDISGV